MNNICVFAKNKETYFIKRLREEVREGLSLFDPWSDFELPSADLYLIRTTGIHHSDLDLMMARSLPQDKVVNPLNVLQRFRSKPSQYDWFDHEDIPHLSWLPLEGTDLLTVEKFFRLYPECVVKPTIGQGGWGVEGMTWERFKSWWKKKKGVDEKYLLQPLVKNAPELRYFFVKGSVSLVLERTSVSGIAANFQREGQARLGSLPNNHQETINRLIEKSGALYGAIDLFLEDDRLIVLELNTVPGIEQVEKVSGLNLVDPLLKLLRMNSGT